MGGWLTPEDGVVSNYYEDQKLMEGPLIKLGDYAHFRYFLLYRNGRFCYYELPMPKEPSDGHGGPRRIQLTLSPEHLRGVMMLNVTLIGKELPQMEDEYASDAIQRGLAFNRKRLEMNLTGISLTGQLTSWKLRASNDATYTKWEKAFRLALRPIWMQNTSTCMICCNEFTLLFRPHHCRKCGTCMCEECSVFVPRLAMQGYYDVVRICRDCSPQNIQQSDLKVGSRVLVYGMYPGKIIKMDATEDSASSSAFVTVEWEKKKSDDSPAETRRVGLGYVEHYSETVLSANRIKNTIRRHLAQTLFRAQLNFSTWNQLETVQEQRTVQMVRILSRSSSINDLRSMVPTLGSYDAPQFIVDDEKEQELIQASMAHYRGVHITFPLRLETAMKLIDQFRNGILLHRVYVYQILDEAHKALRRWNPTPMNTISIQPGVSLIVVGDLHGQLEDLLTILDKNGVPSQKTWYLFNGDFVDRGSHGVEVMMLLLTFKLLYPEFVFLNRGNHEERMINENFGFEDEIYAKYSAESANFEGADTISCSQKYSCVKLFEMFEDVFTILPIFALINERVFATHGGLSSHENVTIEELKKIDHLREIPTQGTRREDELFTHLLWSDPRDIEGYRPSDRGAGIEFGPDITKRFCADNQLSLVIRSHECQEEGYEITHDGLLLTIFSASSYCGSQTNKGAFVQLQVIDNGSLQPHVVQYYAQPLQKLLDAGKNEWRKKAVRLERRTMMSLAELICEKKGALAGAFGQYDREGTGRVTKLQWRDALQSVLDIEVRFLSYFHDLAGIDADEHDRVDYEAFLSRYSVELNDGNVDWRRHLLRRVWLAFCEALKAKEGEDVDKMSMPEKLRAAFNLFQSSSVTGNQDSQVPKELQSIRGVATQKSHDNFVNNGFIAYDVFRTTIQGRLGLGDTLSEQQILELMQHMDQNHDGFVDFDEFRIFFAEFSRVDYLQQIFDVDDVKAVDLLQQFGTHLNSYEHFETLQEAFKAIDRSKKGTLQPEDLQIASQTIQMIPSLDEEHAEILHSAILRTYYGAAPAAQRKLDWTVFEDVFSPDSAHQRSLLMTSFSASGSNLLSMVGNDEDARPLSPRSRKKQTWIDALLQQVTTSLHEQRLYLKFVFRMLDKKRRGYVPRSKFISAMKCVNHEYGSPLKDDQLEQLADAFMVRTRRARAFTDSESEAQEMIAYPSFLKSLRVTPEKVVAGGKTIEVYPFDDFTV
ncbi:hypothetical protein Poli38472_003396 [Pythium oligandrum]|uniref:Serine/threonine-protein phosphatase n=1 Tax=Pythium oligandrum TaxID=41045 RepID=A0A8K1C6G0_PYTOL|nr:hypothetical protein Poli38472_003396 [Pythium oligandrum]|eukprot:TMW57471.1 hypothetical protein Poli38472_003396 [Pythium oligandrum]